MIDYIRKDKNIIISDEAYDIYRKYIKIKELLNEKYQREVSFSEICKYMNIDENNMVRIIESIYVDKSETSLDNSYVDSRDNIDNEIFIQSEINNLTDYEKSLINYRYYLGYTQDETASILGTNQVKISRNETLILKKLRENITK